MLGDKVVRIASQGFIKFRILCFTSIRIVLMIAIFSRLGADVVQVAAKITLAFTNVSTLPTDAHLLRQPQHRYGLGVNDWPNAENTKKLMHYLLNV